VIEAEETLRFVRALAAHDREATDTAAAAPLLARAWSSLGIPADALRAALRAITHRESSDRTDAEVREVAAYFARLADARVEIERFVDSFRADEWAITHEAFSRTRAFLPTGATLGEVRFVIVPLGLDFRTEGQSAYVDPLAGAALGAGGVRTTLAHEFHHIARFRLTGEDLTLMRPEPTLPAPDAASVARYWATWLEAEGIADCVSNVTDTDVPALRSIVDLRRRQMADYETLLRGALDAFRAADTDADTTRWVRVKRELLPIAHPVGARMAQEILAGAGRGALVDCVGRPAAFVRQYNEVAIARRRVTFDDRFLSARAPG
jgi:hypothetical protein